MTSTFLTHYPEENLRDSRNMLQMVLDTIPSGVFWKDRDLIYQGCNSTWMNWAGLNSLEEIIGKTDYELSWSKNEADSFRDDDRMIIKSGVPKYDIIEPYFRADGTQAWAKTNKVPLRDKEGSIIGLLGTSEDITCRKQAEDALKQSEKLIRAIVDAAQDIIVFKDNDFIFRVINPAMCRLVGKTEAEIIGKTDFDIFPLDQARKYRADDQRVIETRQPIMIEEEVDSIEGVRWFSTVKSPAFDDKGKFIGVAIAVRDITDHKRVEEELLRAQKMKSIGTLAGGIAHDFNNMLTIIIGNNEIVSEETPDWSPIKENLEEIRIASLRARDVVKQLLMVGQRDNANKEIIDTGSIVKETIKLIRSTTPANIKIIQKISEKLPPIIGNATQINQLLINLCVNAADALAYTDDRIMIELCDILIDETKPNPYFTKAGPGRYVKLIVSDNGCGIGKEVMEKIFDPYFTTKEIGKGTGIGLSVVNGIVETH